MARLAIPDASRHFVRAPNTSRTFTPKAPYIIGDGPTAHFDVNSEGIRGAEFAANQYRILAIGGSTTEMVYSDAPIAWPAALGSELSRTADGRTVWVGNVGRSGNAMPEHVVQFDYLTREYPSIDAVVLLVGINDAAVAMSGARTNRTDAEWVARAFEIYPVDDAHLRWYQAYKRLGLYRLAHRVRARLRVRRPAGPTEDIAGAWLAATRQRRRAATAIDTIPNLDGPLARFRTDLGRVVHMAAERHIRLVLMTQPSLFRADNTPAEDSTFWFGAAEVDTAGKRPATRYYTPRVVSTVLARFNEVTRDVCREAALLCIDLARLVPSTLENFYDGVHFTDAGSRFVADAAAREIRTQPPFSRVNE